MKRAPAWGVLPVDKPVGPTSHDVVGLARRALGTRRIGHTGTLDPFASGLLLLVVGAATRLSSFLTGMDKTYEARARLGVVTDTLDPEGEVVATSEAWRSLERAAVESAVAGLGGEQMQTPPSYSAKKVQGEAAHRRVRRGEAVELEPVPIVVRDVELTEFALPDVGFRARCSSGTYVRALARDLGEALGTGAYLTALRRTAVGPFTIEKAVAVDDLASVGAHDWIAPADALEAAGIPPVVLGGEAARRLAMGQSVEGVEAPGLEMGAPSGRLVAALDGDGLVAVARLEQGRLSPHKVFRSVAVS